MSPNFDPRETVEVDSLPQYNAPEFDDDYNNEFERYGDDWYTDPNPNDCE